MSASFYTEEELLTLGLKSYGENVLISKKASIYQAEQISIGNNVRIDDFCVLSGKIVIGNNVHIAVYVALFGGKAGIEIHDFACVSSRGAIYAKSDDYSGNSLTNPMVPEKYLGVTEGKVVLRKHVLIGSGSTILPDVEIGVGSAVGSMSLVNKSLEAWGIYVGIPCRYLKPRSKKILELEKEYLNEKNEEES